MAKVNESTIFRLYKNKNDLFLGVVKKFASTDDIDLMNLQASLSMENFQKDINLIVHEYFKIYFSKVHVLRIFITNLVVFKELRGFGYLIIPKLEEHLKGYLAEMEARKIIKVKDLDVVSNFFMSTILRDVSYLTTFKKIEQYDQNIAKQINTKWKSRIDFFCEELVKTA